MTSKFTKKQYLALIEEIRSHNRLYYVESNPEISDQQYDELIVELKQIENLHPEWVADDSPTRTIGDRPDSNFPSFEHLVPMLSIDNTYSEEELKKYDQRIRKILNYSASDKIEYLSEYKIDGVSIALHYHEGKLSKAVTRGDGRTGDDVTVNIRMIRSIPEALKGAPGSFPKHLEIRGELFMKRSDFEEINLRRSEGALQKFANPRNATAGSIKLLNRQEVSNRSLQFTAHGIGYCSDKRWTDSYSSLYAKYESMGIPVADGYKKHTSVEALISHCLKLQSGRADLDFEVDGAVIKINQFGLHDDLGFTVKSPRFMTAYKFPAERKTTVLRDVIYQVGRTGVVTPVAVLKPVLISGSTVSRATLHNFDEIGRLGVRIGDTVVLEKSGEIIPKIIAVDQKVGNSNPKKIIQPMKCPICSSPLLKSGDIVAVRCENKTCPAVFRAALIHFASRKAMDIEGLGESMVDQLIAADLVKSASDLYRLTENDLISLERMGNKSVSNLLQSIAESRQRGLARLLFALGIFNVGEKLSSAIAEYFGSIDKIMKADIDTLLTLDDLGPIAARSIKDFFSLKANQRLVMDLKNLGVDCSAAQRSDSGTDILKGLSFVVTGVLSTFTRDEIHDLILRNGGRTSNSVSRKTSYLIAGESAGSKLTKARGLGVKVIDEKYFIENLLKEKK